MSCQGVKLLASEHPYEKKDRPTVFNVHWLKVVAGCYKTALHYEDDSFPGSAVSDEVGWFPSLSLVARYGILEKEGRSVRGGKRAYWIMPDVVGVEKALRELGRL